MKNQLQTKVDQHTELSEPELPNVGEWFWLKKLREDYPNDPDWEDHDVYENLKEERGYYWKGNEELVIVEHIASNHIRLGYISKYGDTSRISFDDFHRLSRPATDAKQYLESRVGGCHKEIEQLTGRLARIVDSFNLLPTKADQDTLLPSATLVDLNKYKNELVIAKQDTIPQIQEEIKEESEQLGIFMNAMTYPLQVKADIYDNISTEMNSKIFTVQLYCGIDEGIKQLKKGKAADMEIPISVRQTLLYMDEECLLDIDHGGLDVTGLNAFDRWVVEDRNLSRILPEDKCIVAFQVRRNDKSYRITDIQDCIRSAKLNEANKWTYLLIRNGDNVHRLVTGIDFRPNLFPTVDQMSKEELFTKKGTYSDDKDELITPDDFDYDDQVKKVTSKITHYKRVMLIIQGLLDRTTIFKPIPKIRLDQQEQFSKWINLIRDEENVIDSEVPDFDAFRVELNKKIKKGHYIIIADHKDFKYDYESRGRWHKEYFHSSIPSVPTYVEVESVKRDRSKVKVYWPRTDEVWSNRYGYREPMQKKYHLWIKMSRVLNVLDYEKGSIKRFFENKTIRENYLKWARAMIEAEQFDVNKIERV